MEKMSKMKINAADINEDYLQRNASPQQLSAITSRVEHMYKRIDVDGSGEIDFSEWIIAAIDKKALLVDENVKRVFSIFDADGGGSISATELKDIMVAGQDINVEVLQEAINQVDVDGNGDLELDEFTLMMQYLIDNKVDMGDDKSKLDKSGLKESENILDNN